MGKETYSEIYELQHRISELEDRIDAIETELIDFREKLDELDIEAEELLEKIDDEDEEEEGFTSIIFTPLIIAAIGMIMFAIAMGVYLLMKIKI
jgi:hypothetical protein